MYLSFGEYVQQHSDLTAGEFTRLELMARKIVDDVTTGIDGVRKLQMYFPTDGDAEYVKLCVAELVHDLHNFEVSDINSFSNESAGRVIASVSSGSESISYTQAQTAYNLAGKDREKFLRDKATSFLRGLYDANGVSLLYMGAYNV